MIMPLGQNSIEKEKVKKRHRNREWDRRKRERLDWRTRWERLDFSQMKFYFSKNFLISFILIQTSFSEGLHCIFICINIASLDLYYINTLSYIWIYFISEKNHPIDLRLLSSDHVDNLWYKTSITRTTNLPSFLLLSSTSSLTLPHF